MKILFEDSYILIVYKDSGIPSQQDNSGCKSLTAMAEEYTNAPVHIITRLDRPVMGLVLFAKDTQTANKLTAMLKNNEITKIYHAVVCGNAENNGHIETYLLKDSRLNISKPVNKGNVGAKLAILDYKLLESKDNLSKVEINLKTGRHHQIRAQFASIGMPLYGDIKYNKAFKHKRNVFPALCACRLLFIHPVTNKSIVVEIDDNLSF